jgi:hypothetical protein
MIISRQVKDFPENSTGLGTILTEKPDTFHSPPPRPPGFSVLIFQGGVD